MIIGNVVGTVICTRKNFLLTGNKFLIIEPRDELHAGQSRLVAVDNVGAGVGDIVLVATGSAARAGMENTLVPVDALVVGIVDDPSKIVMG